MGTKNHPNQNNVGGLIFEVDETPVSKTPTPTDGIVLVVDDSKANAEILKMILSQYQFQILTCYDGQQAYNTLLELTPEERNQLRAIFCDLSMPKMSGIELLALVRAREDISRTPFVICSGYCDRKTIEKVASLSATGFIVKPLTQARVHEKITALFPERAVLS